MTVKVFPTLGDVGGAGAGKVLTEANLVSWLKPLLGGNFVVSGFTVPASSATLNLDVAAGESLLSGYRVVIDTTTTLAMTASVTNHIYLKLTRDASQNVTEATFEVNTTGTAPADSVKIATATADASTVTSTADARVLMLDLTDLLAHKHTGAAGDSPKIDLTGLAFDPATQAEMDAKFDAATGHKHTGAAGDAPNVITFYAGGVYLAGATTERNYVDTVYVKAKAITIRTGGALRVNFDLRSNSSGIVVYGQIYKNGVAVGTERSTTLTTYTTFSEDIAGFNPNDIIELWVKTSSAAVAVYLSNFALFVTRHMGANVVLD